MTIPSIGGNNSGNDKFKPIPSSSVNKPDDVSNIVNNNIPTPAQEQAEAPVPSQTPAPAPAQTSVASPAAGNGSQKDEDSILELYKKFESILRKEVLPELEQYEPKRKSILFYLRAVPIGIFVLSLLSILVFFVYPNAILFSIPIVALPLLIFVYKISLRIHEKKFKKKYMPILMKAMPNFKWLEISDISIPEIRSTRIFENPKLSRNSKYRSDDGQFYYDKPISLLTLAKSYTPLNDVFDDCFKGTYRGVNIAISEYAEKCWVGREVNSREAQEVRSYNNGPKNMTWKEVNIFKGVVIRFSMNKKFDGYTVLRPKTFANTPSCADLEHYKMEKVVLEDVEFNKNFSVYSTDQIEARYLLTTSFMDRLRTISMAFGSKNEIYCSFYNDYFYLAIDTNKDLFKLFSLDKPMNDLEQYKNLLTEITTILQLVDLFKLDKKLGL